LQDFDDGVLKVAIALAVLEPVTTADALVGSAELLCLALAVDMSL
jgi:hypothetical protein